MVNEQIAKALSHPFSRRLGLWFSGVSIYYWGSWLYDYLFVSFILWKYGNITGGSIVMFASMLLDLGTLVFYDWFKKDWLALEALKETENKQRRLGTVIQWLHDKGAIVTIVVLSILTTPFIATAFMRKGANRYDGMQTRDAIVFIASSLISNLYWIVIVGSGVSLAKYAYNLFI